MNRLPSSRESNQLNGLQSGTEVVEVMSSPPDWRGTSFTIKDKLYTSLVTGCFSDVRFTVGQIHKKEIPAHRYILFLNSPVFEALLDGSHLTKSVNLTISDVEPEAFMSFLKFLYTDEFDVHVKDATAVLYLSKKYDVPRLAVLSADFIKSNINTKNVVSVLLSAEVLGESSIAIQARHFLRTNIRYVIHEDDFLQLNVEELGQIFACDELAVSEMELFNASVHWAIEECKRQKMDDSPQNYRLVLKTILPLIRFPLMDRREFTLHVATKRILTDSECLNVMMHWDVKPNEHASLPPLLFSNKPRRERMETIPENVNVASFYTNYLLNEEQQPREIDKSYYYYDANQTVRGYRPAQVAQTAHRERNSKPPPPPRKIPGPPRHQSATNMNNMKPFTYLPDPNSSTGFSPSYIVDYGGY